MLKIASKHLPVIRIVFFVGLKISEHCVESQLCCTGVADGSQMSEAEATTKTGRKKCMILCLVCFCNEGGFYLIGSYHFLKSVEYKI